MVSITRQQTKRVVVPGKERTYQEVVSLLEKGWNSEFDSTKERLKKVDAQLGNPSQQFPVIAITGTNGKSVTCHFISKILQAEKLTVGVLYAPHIDAYEQRFFFGNAQVNADEFVKAANEVFDAAQSAQVVLNTVDTLALMAFVLGREKQIDVLVVEAAYAGQDPVGIASVKVLAITRLVNESDVAQSIKGILNLCGSDTAIVSADQNKMHLQLMAVESRTCGAQWMMPIRKIAHLPYPFEQLHGRCAALAERVAQLFIEKHVTRSEQLLTHSLLTKPKTQRGRPTNEAKRESTLNPRKTIDQFWSEEQCTLQGRFELITDEQQRILLDTASNMDALKNVLLGIRLLHYKQPIKGLALIIGCHEGSVNATELAHALRYFFKKTAGIVIFCPVEDSVRDVHPHLPWDVESIAATLKSFKVKAKAATSFAQAFEYAQKNVNQQGLIAVTGSAAIVHAYTQYKKA